MTGQGCELGVEGDHGTAHAALASVTVVAASVVRIMGVTFQGVSGVSGPDLPRPPLNQSGQNFYYRVKARKITVDCP
ncbi:hypothetical protein CLE01_22090 [Cryobacterium levicorallinum]|nr:hypothetical protein CLE01_22090 [Cryobacterium levicorallinum]